MLTAKDGEYDQAEALDTGADDFLTKPFSFVVLLARLRALIRRGGGERPTVLVGGRPAPRPGTPPCRRGEAEIELTPAGVLAAGVPDAPRRRGRVEVGDPRERVGLRLRRRSEHRRGLRRVPAQEDRRAVRPATRSRPSGAPATGSTPMAGRSRGAPLGYPGAPRPRRASSSLAVVLVAGGRRSSS